MRYLYHYTDEISLTRILKSGFIKASTDETLDCTYGKGVYLTSLDPSYYDKRTVAENNYDGGWQTGIMAGKVNSFIGISIPSSDRKLQEVYGDRDIYLYKGDLHWPNFHCTCGLKEDETVRTSLFELAAAANRPVSKRKRKRLQKASGCIKNKRPRSFWFQTRD